MLTTSFKWYNEGYLKGCVSEMPISVVSSLIVYMIVSSFTPGPGNILSLNTIIKYGWKKGKIVIGGICAGYYCVQMICGVCIYALSLYVDSFLGVLKYVGGVYLVWLAFHIIMSKPECQEEDKKPSFWTGFFLQFVNVKIYIYGMSALSGYVIPYYRSFFILLFMGLIMASVGSLASLTWAGLGVMMQKVYEKYYKGINIILGVFLMYCAWNMIII